MKFFPSLFLILFSTQTFAWGPTGHRTVGELASRHLSLKAKKEVQKILGKESMAKASMWPDEIKSDPTTYSHTYSWHYTDWRDDQETHDHEHNNGKLLVAISENLNLLKNAKASLEDKKFALRFIIHLIGDLHMPLHVGNGLDKGGNDCQVMFQGLLTNLHKAWDEDMINFTRLSFTEMVDFIDVANRDEIRKIQSGSPLDWALESKVLRGQIYPEEVVKDPTQKISLKNYCNKELPLPVTHIPQLGFEYSYRFMPVIERRMMEAGLRLAHILNQTLK